MADTTTAVRHEVEVDTRSSAALSEWAHLRMRADGALRHLDYLEERAAKYPERAHLQMEVDEYRPQFLAAAEAARIAYAAWRVIEDNEYTGWSRFYLVRASNGHIHSSMSCTTCFPTTEYGWLVDVSGLTEAEAVAAHGERLCTICYPSAPSAWTDADAYYARLSREGRGVRAAAKQARADEKAAKAAQRRLTFHYGERFTRSDGVVFNRYESYRGGIDWGTATTLKAIVKSHKEYPGDYNGHTEIIDLDTLEVVTMEQAEALLKEQRAAAKGAAK